MASRPWLKALRLVYEVAGGLAICYVLFWYGMSKAFKDFAGSHCEDTNVVTVHSPGGTEIAQQRLRTCGAHSSVEVALNAPGQEANFMRVISLAKVDPQEVSFKWTGPNDLEISFPPLAEIEEAYGVVWGVTVTRRVVPYPST